jgi:hypothetical protein
MSTQRITGAFRAATRSFAIARVRDLVDRAMPAHHLAARSTELRRRPTAAVTRRVHHRFPKQRVHAVDRGQAAQYEIFMFRAVSPIESPQ